MSRKISSSLTEFWKLYGVLCFVMFFAFFGLNFLFPPFDFVSFFFILLLLILVGLLFIAFDSWRMKEVEMTDSGLLISRRVFFKQKTIFVPYEKIESIRNESWWLSNNQRVTIEFSEETEFGNEISFMCKGITRTEQNKIFEELNRAVFQNSISEKINSASRQIEN